MTLIDSEAKYALFLVSYRARLLIIVFLFSLAICMNLLSLFRDWVYMYSPWKKLTCSLRGAHFSRQHPEAPTTEKYLLTNVLQRWHASDMLQQSHQDGTIF